MPQVTSFALDSVFDLSFPMHLQVPQIDKDQVLVVQLPFYSNGLCTSDQSIGFYSLTEAITCSVYTESVPCFCFQFLNQIVLHFTADLTPAAFEPTLAAATFTFPLAISNLKWPKEVDSDPTFPYITLLSHDNSAPLTVSSASASEQVSLDLTPSHAIPYTFIDPSVLNPLLAAAKIGSVKYRIQKVVTYPRFIKADEQPIRAFEFMSSSSYWNDPNVVFSFTTSLPLTSPDEALLVLLLPAIFVQQDIVPADFAVWVYIDSLGLSVQLGRDAPLQFGSNFADYLLRGATSDFVFISDTSSSASSGSLSNSHFSRTFFKVVKNSIEIYAMPSLPENLQFTVAVKGMVNPLYEVYFKNAQAGSTQSEYDQLDKTFDQLSHGTAYAQSSLTFGLFIPEILLAIVTDFLFLYWNMPR